MSVNTNDYANQLLAENEKLKRERDELRALAAESNKWKPEVCPVTKRPFFMWVEHPGDGMVPTYGGPYDSYTIPVVDSDGEFSCERYDHDEGAWVDGVCLSERLIDDQMNVHDDAAIREIRAQAVERVADSGEFSMWVQQGLKVWANRFRAEGEQP